MPDRPLPHPDGPFAPPPDLPAIPEYDQKGIGPGIVDPHGHPIKADPPDDRWFIPNPRLGVRPKQTYGDLYVQLTADVSRMVAAFKEAAEGLSRFYEIYVSSLPWYRRWPIRIKMRWLRFTWRR